MTEMVTTQTKPFPRDAASVGFWGIVLRVTGFIIGFVPLIPFLGRIITLIGWFMLFIAYFKLAGTWKDDKMKAYTIWLVISVAIIIAFSVVGGIMFDIGAAKVNASIFNPSELQQLDPLKFLPLFIDLILTMGIWGILGLLFIFAGFVIYSFFYYKLYKQITEISGISEFKTAGILSFVGTLTLSLAGLGGLILLIGTVFAVIAWSKAYQVAVDYKVAD